MMFLFTAAVLLVLYTIGLLTGYILWGLPLRWHRNAHTRREP